MLFELGFVDVYCELKRCVGIGGGVECMPDGFVFNGVQFRLAGNFDFGAFQSLATGNDGGGFKALLNLKDQEALAMLCGIVIGFVLFQTE